MQISKLLIVACLATLATLPMAGFAADTEAQIKAREALEKKLQEMPAPDATKPVPKAPPKVKRVENPPIAKTPAPVRPPVRASAPTPAPAPSATVVATPAPAQPAAPVAQDSEALMKAREALRARIHQLDAEQQSGAASTAVARATPTGTGAADGTASTSTAWSPETPAPSGKMPTRYTVTFTPIEAPPLPITAQKQAQLNALLTQYQADQITPEQYHEQRAKILAGP